MLIDFDLPLEKVKFVKRYKRFFVDVLNDNGDEFAVHCANSGSMKSCTLPNCDAYILDSQNPDRKLRHSLELLQLADGLACLNTQRANQLTDAFLKCMFDKSHVKRDELIECASFEGSELFSQDFLETYEVKKEAKFNEGTRFDFCLTSTSESSISLNAAAAAQKIWIEVKSVSLRLDENTIAFPDAVTERGQKHLTELSHAITLGHGAFLFFVVMRASNLPCRQVFEEFRPAAEIDPKYAALLKHALDLGVKVRLIVADIKLTGLGVRGYFKYSL